MQVQLFKKVGTYIDTKDNNKEKRFINFYLKCGDALVPVEVCYFPQAKFDNRDPQYAGRKEVLSAFAETLPDLPAKDKPAPEQRNTSSAPEQVNTSNRGNPPVETPPQPVPDDDIPF